jgi:ABC-2 type transport system permease protein
LSSHPNAAVTSLAVRQVRRGTLVVLAVVAGLSALVVGQYRSTFDAAFSPASLDALAASPAIRVLFGEPVALDQPGGFTVWRTGTVVAVLVAIWALLVTTRVSRGEEDAGRWDLLLAGRLSLTATLARHLAVLAGAPLLVGAGLGAAMLLAGTQPAGALVYGAGVGLIGTWFVGVGALTAQLAGSRRAAAGLGAAVLGVALLLRMTGDGAESLGWLHWATPFGLLAEAQPYGADRASPLLVLAVASLALCVAALLVSRQRDLGAGIIAASDTRPPRTASLQTLPRFAARRLMHSSLGWATGIMAYYLLFGLLAVSATQFLADNPKFARLAAQSGFTNLGAVDGYAAAVFGLLALPTSLYVVSQVAANAADESASRLTLLFALPVSRLRWLGSSAVVVLLAAVLLTAAAGLAAWVGAVFAGAPLGLAASLAGALNSLPVMTVSLGAAVFALGWLPEAVFAVGALPAVGGYLLQSLADSLGWPDTVARLSPLTYQAAVPAVGVDWGGAGLLVVVGLGLGCVGAAGYRRRDLRG